MPSRSSAQDDPFARSLDEALLRTLRVVERSRARRLVIDGRSGVGKSTLARLIAGRWPGGEAAQVLGLDEIYPGWGGLREGAALATELVLRPHAAGEAASYRRFDWDRGTFAGPRHEVIPSRPLIVEGCGALSAASSALADASVWMDGAVDARRRRAFERDGEGFVPYWDMWAAQEEAHIVAERPHGRATLRVALD